MTTGTCRGCRKSILWVKDRETGASIPVDTTPPVYGVTQDEDNNFNSFRANQKFNSDGPMFFVSHFATCPKANDFSRSRKPAVMGPVSLGVDQVDQKARAGDQGEHGQ